jgi:hypothetical protein
MKIAFALIPLAVMAINADATAQAKFWRCAGNAYTNDEAVARTQACKLVEGGNVTVVTGTRVNGAAAGTANTATGNGGTRVATAPPSAAAGGSGARVESNEQKARDSDARLILEAELRKSETRLAELQKEFNNGEPEMLGPEHRNRQKYLDRIAELKASMERTEKDIAGLKRELARGAVVVR